MAATAESGQTPVVEQGTVWSFDAATHEGAVVRDDGLRRAFQAAAFDRSQLRLLRPGQRVQWELAGDTVTVVAVLTVPVPD